MSYHLELSCLRENLLCRAELLSLRRVPVPAGTDSLSPKVESNPRCVNDSHSSKAFLSPWTGCGTRKRSVNDRLKFRKKI